MRSAIGDNMSKARVALVVVGDAMLVSAIALLLQIDKLINGTLYDYGLVFSDDWAQPYWLMLRITLFLIVIVIVILSIIELPYPAFEETTEEDEAQETVRQEYPARTSNH
jgi:formate hydrogenlyase subunit 4